MTVSNDSIGAAGPCPAAKNPFVSMLCEGGLTSARGAIKINRLAQNSEISLACVASRWRLRFLCDRHLRN
jgi:hypothetical protein